MKVPWMQLGCIAYSLTMPHTTNKEYFLELCMMEVPWKHLGCYYQVKCRDIHRLKKPTQTHLFTWRNRSTGMTYSEFSSRSESKDTWEQKQVVTFHTTTSSPDLAIQWKLVSLCFFRESSGALNYHELHKFDQVWFFKTIWISRHTCIALQFTYIDCHPIHC